MSAQGSRSIGRGLNRGNQHASNATTKQGIQAHHYSGTNIFSVHSGGANQRINRQRQRTAQPNQRQKMIEKIRDVKQKEQTRLRETLMRFYQTDSASAADEAMMPRPYHGGDLSELKEHNAEDLDYTRMENEKNHQNAYNEFGDALDLNIKNYDDENL